jgi:zinc protease
LATGAAAQEVEVAPRRSTAADLTPRFERYVTANGLVVLLSPDPGTNGVVVDLSFAAGALYQPPGKAGLAHLVEHVFSSGASPDTDYRALLERKGGLGFNALTTLDRLSFRVLVPPEELPLALWTNADRLGALAPTLTEGELRRHQRVVMQERVHRIDDAPYGGNMVALMRSLFPEGHPARAGVIGSRDEISSLTLDDVKNYQRTLLVPANGVLTLAGNFDPAVARAWVEKTLGTQPSGNAAPAPAKTPARTPDTQVAVTEELARRPKVTLAWTLASPLTEVSEALQFGSLLLTLYTDGFVGMNVNASLLQFTGGNVFVLEVTMPHATDKLEAAGNAEVVFRYLSQAIMPNDLVGATLLAWDRNQMALLESSEARATFLTQWEVLPPDPLHGLGPGERHWAITPDRIQALAGSALRGKRVTIQSRPTHPLPPKVDR